MQAIHEKSDKKDSLLLQMNKDQINQLIKHFNITFEPSYVVVDEKPEAEEDSSLDELSKDLDDLEEEMEF